MAVTANQVTTRSLQDRCSVPVDAGEHIYEGTMFFVEAASGLAVADTGSGANKFGGVALQEQDNTNGADGDLNVQGYSQGIFEFPGTGFTQASVGSRVYATDNYTVTTDPTASNAVYIGECEYYVSSTVIGVKVDSAWAAKLPVNQGAAFTQTYSTADRTVPAATAATVATTGSSNSTPYGYTTSAQADAIVTNVNALVADSLENRKLLNAIIDTLQAAGLCG